MGGMHPGGLHLGMGLHPRGFWADPPSEYGHRSGGMYPTGMHSWLNCHSQIHRDMQQNVNRDRDRIHFSPAFFLS